MVSFFERKQEKHRVEGADMRKRCKNLPFKKTTNPYTLKKPKEGSGNADRLKHAPMHDETTTQALNFYGKAVAFLFSLKTQAYEKKGRAVN